jgi:hypothetical protein
LKLVELIAGILVTSGFGYLLQISIIMPNYGNFWTGPGAFPAILAGFLTLFGLIWVVDTAKKVEFSKVFNGLGAALLNTFKKTETKRLLLIIAMTVFYIYALIPLISYIWATFIFLMSGVMLFSDFHWLKGLGLSVVLSVLVYCSFQFVLHLPMPR